MPAADREGGWDTDKRTLSGIGFTSFPAEKGRWSTSRLVPVATPEMRAVLAGYVGWYNAERPHQGLGGDTPLERAGGKLPAKDLARLEPRARYPDTGLVKLRKRRPTHLRLRLTRPEDAPHLPVVRLDAA